MQTGCLADCLIIESGCLKYMKPEKKGPVLFCTYVLHVFNPAPKSAAGERHARHCTRVELYHVYSFILHREQFHLKGAQRSHTLPPPCFMDKILSVESCTKRQPEPGSSL